MGANAQTTVPTFTASQVLTAAELNASARTGVPVFSSTGNRDAAFGGSGEKTLAEGQLCYVEGTGLQTYNAAGAWVTWGAVGSGMALVSSTAIGTTVSSVTVSNAFSSTYDNYVIFTNVDSASTTLNLNLTLGSTATGYYRFVFAGSYSSSTVSGANNQNATSYGALAVNTNGGFAINHVINPNLARQTGFITQIAEFGTASSVYLNGGYLNDTTAYTAFTLTTSTGTITGGNIRVYGYRNS